jgi:hypothetical protein
VAILGLARLKEARGINAQILGQKRKEFKEQNYNKYTWLV